MKNLLMLILMVSSCNNVELPKIKIKIKTKVKHNPPKDTLSISEKQGLRQIKFLDSLHKAGKF